mgnify:FL=1
MSDVNKINANLDLVEKSKSKSKNKEENTTNILNTEKIIEKKIEKLEKIEHEKSVSNETSKNIEKKLIPKRIIPDAVKALDIFKKNASKHPFGSLLNLKRKK